MQLLTCNRDWWASAACNRSTERRRYQPPIRDGAPVDYYGAARLCRADSTPYLTREGRPIQRLVALPATLRRPRPARGRRIRRDPAPGGLQCQCQGARTRRERHARRSMPGRGRQPRHLRPSPAAAAFLTHPLRSRSVIADHLPAEASRPARLEQITAFDQRPDVRIRQLK